MKTLYADLAWTAEDVRTLAPHLTVEQAEEWLRNNEHHIRDRLCELGWGVIGDLLTYDGISLKKGSDS